MHSTFTQQLADAICERIAGGKSLRKICQQDGMPTKASVFRWLADDKYESFRDQYARAREAQADTFVDELNDIADEEANDAVAVARNRLRYDARRWTAGKLRPKVYGDKLELAGDPKAPLIVVVRKLSA